MENGQQVEYSEIDCEGLAKCLATEDWKKETNGIPEQDLYQIGWAVDPITGERTIVKEIRDRWSTLMFNLYSSYMILIDEFRRKE